MGAGLGDLMRAKTWLKMTFGTILVLATVMGLLYLYTERTAQVDSEGAGIAADLLPVGTEYGGLIVEQHVEVGDEVSAGDVLFTIESSQLESELEAEQAAAEQELERELEQEQTSGPDPQPTPSAGGGEGGESDATASADSQSTEPVDIPEVTREWEVIAEADGTVADIPIAQGGYVGAGGIVADLFAAGSLYVDVTIRVDDEDLPPIDEGARATVTLPDDATVTGEVSTVRFAQDQRGTVMVLEVESDELAGMAPAGATTPGTPVDASVEITPTGALADLRRAADRAIARLDL